MPLKINPQETYIHSEFKSISVIDRNLVKETKYDKLFDFFNFISRDKEGISECYMFNKVKKVKKFGSNSNTNSNTNDSHGNLFSAKSNSSTSLRNKKHNSSSKQSTHSLNKHQLINSASHKFRKHPHSLSKDSKDSRDSYELKREAMVYHQKGNHNNNNNNIYTLNSKKKETGLLQFRDQSPSLEKNKNNQKIITFKRAAIKHVRSSDVLSQPKINYLSTKRFWRVNHSFVHFQFWFRFQNFLFSYHFNNIEYDIKSF